MNHKKIGVLLINIGSPRSTEVRDVRTYLREFLSDPRVVDIPWISRQLLLNLFILPFRPKKSAEAYKKIWLESEGSPLIAYSKKFQESLGKKLNSGFQVELAMRYGQPSVSSALEKLRGCSRLILFPLYPQYASASTASSMAYVFKELSKRMDMPSVQVVPPFYQEPGFIEALKEGILFEKNKLARPWDHLLFSFHGIPERQLLRTCGFGGEAYCYQMQCFITAKKVAESLGLTGRDYTVSFQSRLGVTPWIKPYTDLVLKDLAKQKSIRRLAVACPSFVTDCLETLEEIGMRGREDWIELGGEDLHLIPCLNMSDSWVEFCSQKIQEAAW
ncbi:MAG: ferrochelatase [Oligoflexales bacterium]|nr:ferrochelatase [Oligoflexales bacterium]